MEFDVDALTELVADFCRSRDVYTRSRCRVVYKLEKAFEIIDRIGPDRRWKTIASRRSGSDFPSSNNGMRGTTVERIVYDLSLIEWANDNSRRAASPWYLSHTVVSAAHWARFSHAIRVARKHGLGWMIPANKDVLIVPRPSLRRLEDRPDVLHNDNGQMAVEWSDGSGYYFLRGTRFSENLYTRIIKGELSLNQASLLENADQRSIALSYMTFDQLVHRSAAELLDVGVKGTALYRLPLPGRIRRDRVDGYGGYDYFIHMRDASHPEREFIEWVDPRVAVRRDAELCQAQAFGITLDEWLSIAQEG
ncbi:hypothetical protein [Mycolicibacterium hippocampi]|uniref:Uncharacterized protein n=1 Tax=Mycolicibacterium hippocampi TaxID=659824 RepID=A0A850PK76_9MYCO|nr:hypothetical protein [Mycolicibacterium hippocampi]